MFKVYKIWNDEGNYYGIIKENETEEQLHKKLTKLKNREELKYHPIINSKFDLVIMFNGTRGGCRDFIRQRSKGDEKCLNKLAALNKTEEQLQKLRVYMRDYKNKNKEMYKQYNKETYLKNKEKFKQYYIKNKDKIKERNKANYETLKKLKEVVNKLTSGGIKPLLIDTQIDKHFEIDYAHNK